MVATTLKRSVAVALSRGIQGVRSLKHILALQSIKPLATDPQWSCSLSNKQRCSGAALQRVLVFVSAFAGPSS